MNILIAFYSRRGQNYVNGDIVNLAEGNTEVAAGMIQRLAGGDTFRIDTVKEYPVDYHETTAVSRQELKQKERPALASRVEDMGRYDMVFLGYPNWWGTMPMALFSFLEAYDLTGKTILPFCTHEGSGLGRSVNDIRRLCPGARVTQGLAIPGADVRRAEGDIREWLKATGVEARP